MRDLITKIAIIVLLAGIPHFLWACFCVPPGIEQAHKYRDVVFIGVLTSREEVELYMPDHFPAPFPIFNFDVLRISKGLKEYQKKISVLDHYFLSSCGGAFNDVAVGDTVLVTADISELGWRPLRFVTSNACNTELLVNNLAQHDSLAVINSLDWFEPTDDRLFLTVPVEQPALKKVPPTRWGDTWQLQGWLLLALITSVLANLILAYRAVTKTKEGDEMF